MIGNFFPFGTVLKQKRRRLQAFLIFSAKLEIKGNRHGKDMV